MQMQKGKLPAFHEDKLYFDQEKKRFIYFKQASNFQKRRLSSPYFNSQRPDLTQDEQWRFTLDLRNANRYIKYLQFQNRREMQRIFMIMPTQFTLYNRPLMDDYMSKRPIDQETFSKMWTWDDATRMVNMYRSEIQRARNYCLDIPHFPERNFTKEELKQKQDELYEYFLEEMRKPVQRGQIQSQD